MYAVTGATGNLGQLVIRELLQRGVSSHEIIAIARDSAKATRLLPQGIMVREASYDSVEDLKTALVGIDKLLLISSSEVGKRAQQHQNVIEAAKSAGVKFIAYTSILNADKSRMGLAAEHLATEKLIQASKIPSVLLRNGWYIENYTDHIEGTLQRGLIGAGKDGRISAATRADYAAAAAAVLVSSPGSLKPVYELGGPGFTLTELAAAIAKQSKREVSYTDMPASQLTEVLKQAGLPEVIAKMLSDSDEGIARGELSTQSQDLQELLGRAPQSLRETLTRRLNQERH